MARDGFQIEFGDPDEAPIPDEDEDARDVDDIGEDESLPDEDFEAEEDEELEARGYGIPDDAQPESQGEDPFEAELGDEGQGDLSPEDL